MPEYAAILVRTLVLSYSFCQVIKAVSEYTGRLFVYLFFEGLFRNASILINSTAISSARFLTRGSGLLRSWLNFLPVVCNSGSGSISGGIFSGVNSCGYKGFLFRLMRPLKISLLSALRQCKPFPLLIRFFLPESTCYYTAKIPFLQIINISGILPEFTLYLKIGKRIKIRKGNIHETCPQRLD